ncbi:MAG: FAD-dependent oxidoreductase, partial [Ruminococcaceae bacterium]|nr:FAD-dependent oxidoreductase [Oscillospiraceae bacterium]
YTVGLGLENAGITVDGKGRIEINKKTLQTVNANIYAIGDCVDMPQLAHAASAQGVAAAEAIMGMLARGETLGIVPRCVYTSPEIACVGFTERQAVDAGFEIEVGRFPVAANGRSMTAGERYGLAKVIAEKSTGKIIGVHLCCHSATEIISEPVNMISSGQVIEDAERVIHAHPTVSEILGEALLDACGSALNIPPRVPTK